MDRQKAAQHNGKNPIAQPKIQLLRTASRMADLLPGRMVCHVGRV
jgi:hypothetical protein